MCSLLIIKIKKNEFLLVPHICSVSAASLFSHTVLVHKNKCELLKIYCFNNGTGNLHAGFWLLQASKRHSKACLEIPNVIHKLPLLGTSGNSILTRLLWRRIKLLYTSSFATNVHSSLSQGQYQNDLSGLLFDGQSPYDLKIPGDYILEHVFQIDVLRSKWWDLSVLFSMIVIYRIIFFIMIKVSEDLTPWIRGYIARRRLQHKQSQQASTELANRTPSLRGYVVPPTSSLSTSSEAV